MSKTEWECKRKREREKDRKGGKRNIQQKQKQKQFNANRRWESNAWIISAYSFSVCAQAHHHHHHHSSRCYRFCCWYCCCRCHYSICARNAKMWHKWWASLRANSSVSAHFHPKNVYNSVVVAVVTFVVGITITFTMHTTMRWKNLSDKLTF